jgi:hypothetical protein
MNHNSQQHRSRTPNTSSDVRGSHPAIAKFSPSNRRIAADPYPWRNSAPRRQGLLAGVGSGCHPYGTTAVDPEAVVICSKRKYYCDQYITAHVIASRAVERTPSVSPSRPTASPSRLAASPARPASASHCEDIFGASPSSYAARLSQRRLAHSRSPARENAVTLVNAQNSKHQNPAAAASGRPSTRAMPAWWWG